MSLISIHRSPSPTSEEGGFPSDSESNEDVLTTNSSSVGLKSRSLNECYFIVRGAAVILSHSDQASVSPRSPTTQSTSGQNDIEAHLQGMLRVLRPEDTLAMAVRLQSVVDNHVKYLAVLWTVEEDTDEHEAALLGFDFCRTARFLFSIGATVPIHSFSKVELDGDGGITVNSSSCSCPYLFKPVSIQSMWSLFQCLHKELALASLAAKSPLFCGPISGYHWLNYYHSHVTKDDSICAQWHYSLVDEAAEGDIRAQVGARTSSPDISPSSCLSSKRTEEERQIHINLKQIMQSVDLDAVTSKDIRNRLEEQLKVDSLMSMYKEFIDREMLAILGQLDKPSKIFDYLYLGTEWNASNWEELKANKVEYILNVTKEVDNFFPSQFHYLKIWVSDEATTELLMHWQKTYDFIKEAKDKGSAVLVHCKKGISRSSSTVIAFIMKEYGWSLDSSLNYVKDKRNCITPNRGFMDQLNTFHGVLSASNNRHSAFFNPGAVATVIDTIQPTLLTSAVAATAEIQKLARQLSSSPGSDISSTSPDPPTSLKNTYKLSTKCDRLSLEGTSPPTKKTLDAKCTAIDKSMLANSQTQEALKSRSILLKYQPETCKPKAIRSIVRHKSSGTITSAKNFFGSKGSTNALSGDCASKKRASSLVDGNTYANRGKVKQHKENFENRLKNFKGKTQTATSFVSSIAKEISRLSISMSAAQTDNTNHASLKKGTTIVKEQNGCSSIRNKAKAFNHNKTILDINQQQKRNVKSLVQKFEFERGIIVPPTSDGVKLRAVSKQESALCNENLIMERTMFTAQVSLS